MAKPTAPATAPDFIGIENVEHIAEKYEPQLITGAAYAHPRDLARLRVKVVTGVQFKLIKNVFIRKGGTTRLKKVGEEHKKNKIGFVRERVLTTGLAFNMFMDNEDKYRECPVQIDGSANFHYPYSEIVFYETTKTYGEDIYACIWKGDIANGAEGYNLVDGYLTCIAQDTANGFISTAKGNIIECGSLAAPTNRDDYKAWQNVLDWRLKWDPRLRAQEVVIYLSPVAMSNIVDAYINKHNGSANMTVADDNTYTFTTMPKVTFIPVDEWEGEGMIATTPENLIYAVNTESADSFVAVKHGSDNDLKDIIIQIQSIQGCMIVKTDRQNFAMSTAAIKVSTFRGDYEQTQIVATSSDSEKGSVTITGVEANDLGEYFVEEGASVTLKAAATSGGTFVKWSDGLTDETRSVVANGDVMAYVAIFK